MFCKNCGNQMNDTDNVCTSCGTAAQPNTKFCSKCGAQADNQAFACACCGNQFNNNQGQPFGQPFSQPFAQPTQQKSKLAAGLLAIFLGYLGIHNFYLGYTTKGVIQLVLSIATCGVGAVASSIWAIVEAVQIFTGSINCDAKGIPLKD